MNHPLMQYIPTQPEGNSPQPQPQDGARKFTGEIAQGYDRKREESPKWKVEQEIICSMLDDLPDGSRILDAPVGTGRFFGYYERRGFIVRGLDLSVDMIREAAKKVKDPNATINGEAAFAFAQGSVTKIGMPDNGVDAAVMVRMTRWLSPEECLLALRELQRLATKKVIFTARVRNHPHARPYELLQQGIREGWCMHRDEAGYEEDYRIIELRPA